MTDTRALMECLVISGRSGSGKSTALQALEDLGFYCVDNMPLVLLPALLEQLQQDQHILHLAIGIDARNLPEQLAHFSDTLAALKHKANCRVLYLDAVDSVLLQRFDATRRRHPLSNDRLSLPEAIEHESQLLAEIRAAADITIDTSRLDVHSLRDTIRSRVSGDDLNSLTVQIMSFAFKHGVPQDADLLFDVRVLPNPYWQEDLRDFSGHDQAVIDFLNGKPDSRQMLDDISNFILRWLPAFNHNDRSYLTIAIGCTGGRHRSVYIANQLALLLKPHLPKLQLRHRDCPPAPLTSTT